MNNKGDFKGIVLLILAGLFLLMLVNPFYTIDTQQKAVILTFGKISETPIGEGLHMKIPIIQNIVKFDITTQKYEAELTAASKDLQDVNTKIAINYHIDSSKVVDIYRNIGVDYANKVVYPIEQEVNKATTAQFTAEELVTKRELVRNNMKQLLIERLNDRGIIVEDISIVNFAFSPSFTQAIEAKVTAEQNALAAKNKLEQVKYEAQQSVESAKGEAEAITIKAEALRNNPNILQLNAIAKWNGVMPLYVGGDTMPFIGVGVNG